MKPQEAAFPEPGHRSQADRGEPNPVAGRIDAALRDGTPAAPALSSTPTAGDLLRALRRRWMMALALGGTLAGIAAVAVWYLMTPEYTAYAQIRVLSTQPTVIFATKEGNGNQTSFTTYLRTQATQFKDHKNIESALKKDEVKRLNLAASHENPVFYVDEKLKVEIQEGSEFMTVRLNSTDPNEATTLVKALIASYMGDVVYAEDRNHKADLAKLDKAYNDAAANLEEKKASLKKNAELHGFKFSPSSTDSFLLTQIQLQVLENLHFTQQALNTNRGNLIQAESTLDAHVAQQDAIRKFKLSDTEIDKLTKTDAKAAALDTRIDHCKEIVQNYLDNAQHPEEEPTYRAAVRLKSELDEKYAKRRAEVKADVLKQYEDQLKEDRDLAALGLRRNIQSMKKLIGDQEKQVEELSAKVAQFPGSIIELDAQKSEVRRLEQIVDSLGVQREKLRVEEAASPRITAPQDAELEKRDTKKQLAATVAAPVAVFFMVCISLSWIEYRQRRVQTAGEVSHGLGIRVVGSIPNQANLERCFVGAAETDLAGQPVLESIDAIRTMLLHQAQTAATRIVMVTSAVEGEGKTTLASHLAGSLARAGRKTLLLDADLRQPAVHQLFETPLQPGFSEVLLGEVEVADSIQTTTIDGLSIVPAGQWDREVIQSLARGGMEGVFEKLREEFDFIIVDSHPVVSATDSLLIGQHVDAVLLSVLKQVSQMPRVYTACQRLTALNIHVLGAVVSGTDPDEVVAAPNYQVPVEQL